MKKLFWDKERNHLVIKEFDNNIICYIKYVC